MTWYALALAIFTAFAASLFLVLLIDWLMGGDA